MNLDDLTLGQIKSLRGLLGGTMDAVEICPHLGEYVIVRTQSAGVFAGVLRSKNGAEVVIDKCRRLWQWFAVDGIELDGVAASGIDPSAFMVASVNVRNLVVDKGIEEAIRQKAATDQRVEQAQRELLLTKAEADKAIAKAEGEAKANRILAESLTPALIRIREIEAVRDTAAFVASKAGNTVFLGGPVTPLVQVK